MRTNKKRKRERASRPRPRPGQRAGLSVLPSHAAARQHHTACVPGSRSAAFGGPLLSGGWRPMGCEAARREREREKSEGCVCPVLEGPWGGPGCERERRPRAPHVAAPSPPPLLLLHAYRLCRHEAGFGGHAGSKRRAARCGLRPSPRARASGRKGHVPSSFCGRKKRERARDLPTFATPIPLFLLRPPPPIPSICARRQKGGIAALTR